MRKLGLVCGLGLTLLSASAHADYPADAPVRLFNLPDLSGLTALNLELQYTHWSIDGVPNVVNPDQEFNVFTFDLGIDFDVAPHWVVFGHLPFGVASWEVDPEPPGGFDCCDLGLGNLTFGVRRLFANVAGDDLRTVFGGELSLAVPTADDGSESSMLFAFLSRASHDPARYAPNTWVPRLVGHAQLYGPRFLIQAELGFHFFIDSDDDNDEDDDTDIILRAAIAAGVRLGPEWSIVLELNSMNPLDDDDGDSFTSLDAGLRYGARGLTAGFRLFYPFDDLRRDLDMFGIGADIGWRF